MTTTAKPLCLSACVVHGIVNKPRTSVKPHAQGVGSLEKLGSWETYLALALDRYSSGRPVTAASSRMSRTETWPVTGILRSLSNLRIAAVVSGPIEPVAFTGP